MRVGVFGATGYSGREIVRLLQHHPQARVEFSTGTGEGYLPHEEGLARPADAYLLSLPHGVAADYVRRLAENHPQAVIIDLSGDLRLPTPESYKAWYAQDSHAPELLGKVPYGLTEVYRQQIKGARIISNPGCYATSILLPLVPLLKDGLIAPEGIVADSKSGASGAGRTARQDLLFCEVAEDLSAYSPGRVHRHVGEIEWILKERSGKDVALTFCPHLLPVRRGILSAVYVQTQLSAADIAAALHGFYAGAAFVRVVSGKPPRLHDVVMSNDCLISVHAAAPGRLVLFSAIDNLVKGAAGQAIQNLNVACGWPETAGLPTRRHL